MSICHFRGDYAFLSNFYLHPLVYQGMTWKSSEHCYQAMKTTDPVERCAIKMASTPGAAKKLGAKCTMRADWEDIKVRVMRDIVKAKFSDPELASKLIATGNVELIEGNIWQDFTWGCVWDGHEWQGRNLLGNILMEVRAELVTSQAT